MSHHGQGKNIYHPSNFMSSILSMYLLKRVKWGGGSHQGKCEGQGEMKLKINLW